MSFIRRLCCSVLLCLACNGSAIAAGYILGIGAAADSEDGRAFTAFGDFGIGDNTWLSATIGSTETDAEAGRFSTTFADVGIDHYFNPIGIRLSGAYWGDSSILDSEDVRASLYYRDDIASFSADYERRNFDFVFGSILLQDRRKADASANRIPVPVVMPIDRSAGCADNASAPKTNSVVRHDTSRLDIVGPSRSMSREQSTVKIP